MTIDEARRAASLILAAAATPAQVGAFLIALRVKEETAEELAGFTLALREKCQTAMDLPGPLVDCAGAYDGRIRSLPTGVAAALVATRAGVCSLFHGTRGLGRAGVVPGDILSALTGGKGAPGIAYVDQTEYSPALAALKSLRNELGLRTAFNSAEKLVSLAHNTQSLRSVLIGVFHGPYLERMARAAVLSGLESGMVIQGLEGSDDLPATRDSSVCEFDHGEIRRWNVELSSLGIVRCQSTQLECQGLPVAIEALRKALSGSPGPASEALCLNVGLRLYLGGVAEDLADGVAQGRQLIRGGAGAEWASG
jgi:anthranilate phosphoribosyltransferase